MELSIDCLHQKYHRLSKLMCFDGTIWSDIDFELLIVAVTTPSAAASGFIPSHVRRKQIDLYGVDNYEKMEFLGDAVIETIAATMVCELPCISGAGEASKLRQRLVQNATLYWFSITSGLANEIIMAPDARYKRKMAADLVEAMIGVMYHWGYYVKNLGYSCMDHITKWMVDTFGVRRLILKYLECRRFDIAVHGDDNMEFMEGFIPDEVGVVISDPTSFPDEWRLKYNLPRMNIALYGTVKNGIFAVGLTIEDDEGKRNVVVKKDVGESLNALLVEVLTEIMTSCKEPRSVTVISDSGYLNETMPKLARWEKSGWSGMDEREIEILRPLELACRQHVTRWKVRSVTSPLLEETVNLVASL